MVEAWVITLLPALFLIVLFTSGAILERKNIDVDGQPPIQRTVFYLSKYSLVVVWAAAIAQAWGAGLGLLPPPAWLRGFAVAFWGMGFALLFIGRLGLADSFRFGSAQEATQLKTQGLYGVSRNPMYVGVDATLFAASLYTLNPVVILLAIFIALVHHRIILAEEQHLRGAFGQPYVEYCRQVARYL